MEDGLLRAPPAQSPHPAAANPRRCRRSSPSGRPRVRTGDGSARRAMNRKQTFYRVSERRLFPAADPGPSRRNPLRIGPLNRSGTTRYHTAATSGRRRSIRITLLSPCQSTPYMLAWDGDAHYHAPSQDRRGGQKLLHRCAQHDCDPPSLPFPGSRGPDPRRTGAGPNDHTAPETLSAAPPRKAGLRVRAYSHRSERGPR